MEWCPLPVVESVNIGFVTEQKNDALLAAFFASQMERSTVLLILSLKIHLLLLAILILVVLSDERFGHINMVLHTSQVQWGLELVREGIDFGEVLEKTLDRVQISIVSCMMQGSPPITINNVNVSVRVEDRLQNYRFLRIT